MKKIPVLLLAITSFLSAQGQFSINKSLSSDPIGAAYNLWAAKSTGEQPRLLSEVRMKLSGGIYVVMDGTDSTVYQYSGSRGYWNNGGQFEFWKHDVGEIYTYDGSLGRFIPGNYKWVSTYDGADRLLDRVLQQRVSASADWENRRRRFYTYDAAGNIDTETEQEWDYSSSTWENHGYRFLSTYAPDNSYANLIWQWWNAADSVFENVRMYVYSYDAAGRLAIIETKNWDTSSGGMWGDDLRASCSYDVGGNMVSRSTEQWNPATGTWNNFSQTAFSSFVAHRPGITIHKTWDDVMGTYVNDYKIHRFYSGGGQLTFEFRGTWIGGGWSFSHNGTQYHYELSSGLNDVSKAGGGVSVFPVPASKELHINVGWQEAQAFDISIIDVTGSVRRARHVAECRKYDGVFNITDLEPGNYVVRIDGEKGCVVKRVAIVR